jgi:hypothetical protein
VALVPAVTVNVPLIVWLALNVAVETPVEVLPVNDKLLKVLAPVIEKVASAPVKVTLLNVSPAPLNVALTLLQEIVDVLALNVKFMVDEKLTGPLETKLTVDDPRLIVLELELLEDSPPTVRL